MTEKPWQLTIVRANNGFVLKWNELIEKDIYRPTQVVIEEKDTDMEHDCEAIQNMLYEILDYFGLTGSKHDKKRIRVEIVEREDE